LFTSITATTAVSGRTAAATASALTTPFADFVLLAGRQAAHAQQHVHVVAKAAFGRQAAT